MHARFLHGGSGQAGRDLNDYTRMEERMGETDPESGSFRYMAAEDAERFPTQTVK